MATGMAIMGFGGGAMIGSPLATALMAHFKPTSPEGVAPTFLTMGALYFAFMMFGVFTVRVPLPGWRPAGYVPPGKPKRRVTQGNVMVNTAIRTRQFWLLWVMLVRERDGGHRRAGTGVADDSGDVSRSDHGERGRGIRRSAQSSPTWRGGFSGRRCPTTSAGVQRTRRSSSLARRCMPRCRAADGRTTWCCSCWATW
jgi:hypothetical protein